ncbi:Dual specificity protein phosphatase 23 [Mactra antiquata]
MMKQRWYDGTMMKQRWYDGTMVKQRWYDGETTMDLIHHTEMKPEKPYNFSWIIDNQLAGMGYPSEYSNLLYLYNKDITCIVALLDSRTSTAEQFREFTTLGLNVREFSPPTLEQIHTGIEFIENCIADNKSVAVHCAHGIGRTGTLLACYLAKKHHITGDEAIAMLREMRPYSVETSEQEDVVRTYASRVVQ